MKKTTVAIIGAGIVGSNAAYQLSKRGFDVTVFDRKHGQATAAAAGIICPWLSQRRNKNWYQLTSRGAHYYPLLMQELESDGITELPYHQVGTLVFKKKAEQLSTLLSIAEERKKEAPMIGELRILSAQEVQKLIPGWTGEQGAVYASGGGRVDGHLLTKQLLYLAQKNGAKYYQTNVSLQQTTHGEIYITDQQQQYQFDKIIIATGAWLNETLQPLQLSVDVRPQKGQLIEFQLPYATDDWPVCMLHGEIDFLPFENGKIIIGATHENDKGFDLTPDEKMLNSMHQEACTYFSELSQFSIANSRIGTRAYTSDFSPFFGSLPQFPSIYVASGLGSSGLTSGAYIGLLLSQFISNEPLDMPIDVFSTNRYVTALS